LTAEEEVDGPLVEDRGAGHELLAALRRDSESGSTWCRPTRRDLLCRRSSPPAILAPMRVVDVDEATYSPAPVA
jgi:hypothetical protein